jgi:hypothetical protein
VHLQGLLGGDAATGSFQLAPKLVISSTTASGVGITATAVQKVAGGTVDSRSHACACCFRPGGPALLASRHPAAVHARSLLAADGSKRVSLAAPTAWAAAARSRQRVQDPREGAVLCHLSLCAHAHIQHPATTLALLASPSGASPPLRMQGDKLDATLKAAYTAGNKKYSGDVTVDPAGKVAINTSVNNVGPGVKVRFALQASS